MVATFYKWLDTDVFVSCFHVLSLCFSVFFRTSQVLVNRSAPSWLLLALLCSTLCGVLSQLLANQNSLMVSGAKRGLALWRTGSKGLKQLKKARQWAHDINELWFAPVGQCKAMERDAWIFNDEEHTWVICN